MFIIVVFVEFYLPVYFKASKNILQNAQVKKEEAKFRLYLIFLTNFAALSLPHYLSK